MDLKLGVISRFYRRDIFASESKLPKSIDLFRSIRKSGLNLLSVDLLGTQTGVRCTEMASSFLTGGLYNVPQVH